MVGSGRVRDASPAGQDPPQPFESSRDPRAAPAAVPAGRARPV